MKNIMMRICSALFMMLLFGEHLVYALCPELPGRVYAAEDDDKGSWAKDLDKKLNELSDMIDYSTCKELDSVIDFWSDTCQELSELSDKVMQASERELAGKGDHYAAVLRKCTRQLTRLQNRINQMGGHTSKLRRAMKEANSLQAKISSASHRMETLNNNIAMAQNQKVIATRGTIAWNTVKGGFMLLNLAKDLLDLGTDNMQSLKKGGNSDLVDYERAAVAIDGYVTTCGLVALVGAKGTVAVVFAPIGAIPALVVTGGVLLAHTEGGQKFIGWAGDVAGTVWENAWMYFTMDKPEFGLKGQRYYTDPKYRAMIDQKVEDRIKKRTKTANGVGALKPNIYIYPETETDVIVTFGEPHLLTEVIPDYSGSWRVIAQPDGILREENGSIYSYLFYESETQAYYFQKEEGWVIRSQSRAEQYRQILESYGFNDTEIADFVEYWEEKLPAGEDFVMYPQLTGTIDYAMPMNIWPEPDHIFRLWFTFEPYEGQRPEMPQVDKFARNGYTVVEWGGVILNL